MRIEKLRQFAENIKEGIMKSGDAEMRLWIEELISTYEEEDQSLCWKIQNKELHFFYGDFIINEVLFGKKLYSLAPTLPFPSWFAVAEKVDEIYISFPHPNAQKWKPGLYFLCTDGNKIWDWRKTEDENIKALRDFVRCWNLDSIFNVDLSVEKFKLQKDGEKIKGVFLGLPFVLTPYFSTSKKKKEEEVK